MQVGIGILVVAGLVLLYGAFSERLSRYPVTAPMVFVTAGVLVGPAVLGIYGANVSGPAVTYLIKAALALMLFNDAVRIDLGALRREAVVPERLLGIALPLVVGLGAVLGWALFPGAPWAELLLLGLILAPTDAALAHAAVSSPSIPARIRQGLNIESGLSDGFVVPFFLVALDAVQATEGVAPWNRVWIVAAEQIGWALLAGVVVGLMGGLIIRLLDGRHFIEPAWRQIMAVGTAGASFGLAQALGGSVLLASFIAGMVFGAVAKKRGLEVLHLSEQTGAVLASATFITFGALALGPNLDLITWQVALYGVLSLTLVRMVPVFIAMLGSKLKPASVAYLAWFGPRGLASVVFGLILLAENIPNTSPMLIIVTFTVALSVYLHGATSLRLSRIYKFWFAKHAAEAEPLIEGRRTEEYRVRYGTDTSPRPHATLEASDE